MSKENVEALMRELVAELVSDRTENIPVDVNFGHLGLDSMHAIHLVDELEKRLNIEVNPLLFWEYPTIAQLAGRLAKEVGA